jgi:regulator of replication initiation timing
LQTFQEEIDSLKSKLAISENENRELRIRNKELEYQLSLVDKAKYVNNFIFWMMINNI